MRPGKGTNGDSRLERLQKTVFESLEPDQLASAKARHYGMRKLRASESMVLWFLRIYVLFMMGVVVYQVWTRTR